MTSDVLVSTPPADFTDASRSKCTTMYMLTASCMDLSEWRTFDDTNTIESLTDADEVVLTTQHLKSNAGFELTAVLHNNVFH